jgi:hypothetical protein
MAAVIGIGIGLIGTGASAAGSAKAGRKLKQIGGFNASIAEQQAEDALTRGREAEDTLRSGVRKLVGSQRVGYAGQNVSLADVDSSATQVQEDTFTQQNRDVDRIRFNAAREAWGFRQQAQAYRMGSQAQVAQKNAEATGTVLGGLGNAFSSYARVQPYRGT